MKTPLHALPETFAALADPTRLRIVGLLLNGEVCVCHLYETLKIPQSKASRHLAYLRRAGLVEASKRGLWVYYRLTEPRDRSTAAVMASVRSALASLDIVKQDARCLAKTMCCIGPGISEAPLEVVRRK